MHWFWRAASVAVGVLLWGLPVWVLHRWAGVPVLSGIGIVSIAYAAIFLTTDVWRTVVRRRWGQREYGKDAWMQREHAGGFCSRCGYDLTANTSGVCPECGERI